MEGDQRGLQQWGWAEGVALTPKWEWEKGVTEGGERIKTCLDNKRKHLFWFPQVLETLRIVNICFGNEKSYQTCFVSILKFI